MTCWDWQRVAVDGCLVFRSKDCTFFWGTYSVTNVTSVPWDMGMSTVKYRRLYGKKIIIPSSTEAYFNHKVITARWLVHVGLKNEPMWWQTIKKNEPVVASEPMAMQPDIARQKGRGVWLYNQLPCHGISDFVEGSNWGVQLIARPGTQYSFTYLREPRLR